MPNPGSSRGLEAEAGNSYVSPCTSNYLSLSYVLIRQVIAADSFSQLLSRFIFGESKDLAEHSYYKGAVNI